MNDELPQGWVRSPVEKVFRSFGGGTPNKGTSAYWKGTIPWLSSGDIKTERIQSATEYITRAGLENSSANLCRPGSVLVVVRSGILKHTLPVAVLEREAAINQDIKCFDSGCSELNEWLSLALRTCANDILALNRDGTTVQSVKYETLKEFELSIPPLAEQKRIMAKLGRLLSQVDACQHRLARIPTLLKRFRQSVLAAACSGRLTEDWRCVESSTAIVPPVNIGLPDDTECADGWAWKKLTHLARLESGHTPRKTVSAYWEGGDVPWICLQDIRAANGKIITDTTLKPTMHGIDNSSARMLPAGTVVFSRDISVGYVTIMGREMATSQHFADWICGPELNNRFLMYALMASRDHLMASEQGSTVGTIYMPALKEFYVLKPPLTEQQEIVHRVENLLALADRIEERFGEGRKRLDAITRSILAKAFRGELVPKEAELAKVEGRSFESAAELLKRIPHNGDVETPKHGRRPLCGPIMKHP